MTTIFNIAAFDLGNALVKKILPDLDRERFFQYISEDGKYIIEKWKTYNNVNESFYFLVEYFWFEAGQKFNVNIFTPMS